MPWTPPTTYTDDVSTWGAADVMALGTSLSDYTDTLSAELDDDTDLVDAIAIEVPSTKKRRIPIADKAVYDLREFYSGSSQPANVEPYIHDGLAKTTTAGGSLLIPDSVEPWSIASTIVPPPNSRMHGPVSVRFSERVNAAGHGSAHYQMPPVGESMGESWIQLASGANCPVLANDHDNSEGKRGPARGNGAYWQWFTAHGIAFDHNGRNQSTGLRAIDIRDAWGMNFAYCRLIAPRGIGWCIDNSNECNGEKISATGDDTAVANGTGNLASSTTVSNASGTWTVGDRIAAVAGIAEGTYVTGVAGTTLTISAAATATVVGTALTKRTPLATALLALQNTTTDSDWIGISMHGGLGVLLDSTFGCRVSGLAGYALGSHNVWLRDTFASGCFSNKLDLRVDKASKHNVRIDTGVKSNVVDVAGFEPGIYGYAADADGGWATVYCDGQSNILRGSGRKFTAGGFGPTMSAVVAYGPNAQDNIGLMGGGDDLGSSVAIYSYRPTSLTSPGSVYSNTNPGPTPFFIPASSFEAADGSTPAMANFNGTLHRVLSFADGATGSAVAYFTPPVGCRKMQLRVCVVNLNTANSGNARLQLGFMDAMFGQTPGGDEQIGGPTTVAVGATATSIESSLGGFTVTVTPSQVTGLAAIRFKRIGADAADTLTSAVGLLGVRVEPYLAAP